MRGAGRGAIAAGGHAGQVGLAVDIGGAIDVAIPAGLGRGDAGIEHLAARNRRVGTAGGGDAIDHIAGGGTGGGHSGADRIIEVPVLGQLDLRNDGGNFGGAGQVRRRRWCPSTWVWVAAAVCSCDWA